MRKVHRSAAPLAALGIGAASIRIVAFFGILSDHEGYPVLLTHRLNSGPRGHQARREAAARHHLFTHH